MSREGDVPNRLQQVQQVKDDALVDALSGAAREIAATDAGPGPTPAVWHRMQSRLHARGARSSRPPWRGLLVMGAMFDTAFRRFTEAFERRADAIYAGREARV